MHDFPQVFVTLKRAPLSVVAQLNEIPGIAAVEPRIVRDVIVDWPSSMLPVSARWSRSPTPATSRWRACTSVAALRRSPAMQRRCDQRGLCGGQWGTPGQDVRVVLNGRVQSFHITGIALSPEYVYAVKPGLPIPDDRFFAVLWIDRSAAEAAFDMKGAFNDAVVSLAPGADPKPVIAELIACLSPMVRSAPSNGATSLPTGFLRTNSTSRR